MPKPGRDTAKLSPMRLILVLLLSTFIIELGVMALFLLYPQMALNEWAGALIDSSILSALLIPVLFFVVFRPLTRGRITERLAELHGGTVEVASEPGKGSTFTLRLPTEEEHA